MAVKLPIFLRASDNLYSPIHPPFMTTHVLTTSKALIIDDETDICYLLSNILKQKSIPASFVGSISEAERLLGVSEGDFPLIFLDNHLPDGLGVNYIGVLRQRFPTSKIVMITAHDTATDRERAQQQGVDYFISKPFSKDLIFKTIDEMSHA